MAHQLVIKKKSSRITKFLLVSLGIATAVICIAAGYYYSDKDVAKLREQIQQLQQAQTTLEQDLAQSQQLIQEQELENRAITVAREHLQSNVKTLQQDNATLHRELEFYKRIMAPEDMEQGLQLADFAAQPSDQAILIKTSLYQAGRHDGFLKGSIDLDIEVEQDGELRWLTDDELNQQLSGDNRYTFRYFQHLEHQFVTKSSQKIKQIKLRVLKSNQVVFERTLNWES